MDTVSAEFFYRKPLREDEPKPAFGLVEPDLIVQIINLLQRKSLTPEAPIRALKNPGSSS